MQTEHPSNSDSRFVLGFARQEWAEARFEDPSDAEHLMAFIDAIMNSHMQPGLASIGTDALLAIARVSPDFARRLRAQLEAADPDWRDKVQALILNRPSQPGAPEETLARRHWTAILGLIDSAGP